MARHSRLLCVRIFLEDCLDDAKARGPLFDPHPWRCLIDLFELPSVQRDSEHASDGEIAYIVHLHGRVVELLDGMADLEACTAGRERRQDVQECDLFAGVE